jgi:predicted O-linked N-acetylglucosamine transferase (SPINDLY family)
MKKRKNRSAVTRAFEAKNRAPGVSLETAKAFHATGRLGEARKAYEAILEGDPQNFDAIHHLGILALQRGAPTDAIPLLMQAVESRPRNAQAHANLGTAYLLANLLEDALAAYDVALELAPGLAGGWRNRGTILQRLGRHKEAADAFQRCSELVPGFDFALGSMFESRRFACDWRDYEHTVHEILAGVNAGRNADRPFSFLSVTGSAHQQLRCATLHARYLCPRPLAPEWRGEIFRHDKIRIAYVSADYRAHVVMKILAPLLESHDPRHFDIVGVSLGGEDDSEILRRAKRALPRYVNVSSVSDAEAAKAIRSLEVDIAVDLTGYTAGCRPGIFARRPAPVQVGYLGYLGTSGSSYMDYLIADRVAVPAEAEQWYSERIVRLPPPFLPPDDREAIASHSPTREELGLPQASFVFCAFSTSYKFNPPTFDIWMRLLREVPGSVLWLRDGDATMRSNLAHEAGARQIDPQRLVFAPKVAAMQDHLARHRQADLFLDTWPFGAHATARDALWAGLPVLTCLDESFASRVAGSLLTALHLPELITQNLTEYEQCALALARDRDKLSSLRSRLERSLRDESLFDTGLYCRHLESAYRTMWQRSERGEGAVSFPT